MQNFIRHQMVRLGALIQKVEHLFQKRAQGGKSKQSFPALTAPLGKIEQCLESVEQDQIFPLIPNLAQKQVLSAALLGSSATPWETLSQRGAENIFHLEVETATAKKSPLARLKPADLLAVRGSWAASPFADERFDFIFFSALSLGQFNFSLAAQEVSRVLKANGKLLLSVPHPHLLWRLSPRQGFLQRIDSYFAALKKFGIFIDQIQEIYWEEGKFDDSNPESKASLSEIEGEPFLLFLRGVRLKANSV